MRPPWIGGQRQATFTTAWSPLAAFGARASGTQATPSRVRTVARPVT